MIIVKIGFFDSGIGGITVLYEAIKILPREDYIYYADTLNVPYGIKPKNVVKEYILNAINFIMKEDVKAIVIACNTATSIAIEELRSIYSIPILGMEPAVKPAVLKSIALNKRVLVTATPLTLKEEKLKNLITRLDNESIVDLLALPKLVEYAEGQRFEDTEIINYLRSELLKFNLEEYGTIVLGCTHFPYYKNIFKKLLPKEIDVIDGNSGTVKNLKRILDATYDNEERSGQITYYNSGVLVTDSNDLAKFDNLLKRLALIDNEALINRRI